MELVLLLTVPVVDPDKDDLNWKRPLNCLHVLTSPLLCVLTLKSGTCKNPGLPGGDGTEMATKALGTTGALWSWHPVLGRGGGASEEPSRGAWFAAGWLRPPHRGGGLGPTASRSWRKSGADLACLGKLRHRGEQPCEGLG